MVVTRSQTHKSSQSTITTSFQICESSNISSTIVATTQSGQELEAINTIKSQVAVRINSPVSNKRKSEDVDTTEYPQATSSPKKRTVSAESNLALSTRPQLKAFGELFKHARQVADAKVTRASKRNGPGARSTTTAPKKAPQKTDNTEVKEIVLGPIHKYTKHTLVVRLRLKSELLAIKNPELYDSFLALSPVIKDQPSQRGLVLKRSKAYWDNAAYKVKFGVSLHLNFASPTIDQAREVFEILSKDLREKHSIVVNADGSTNTQIGPVHGTQSPTVDIFVRTIMAQGTGNVLALAAQEEMRDYFRYEVDGAMVKGLLPNYHAMLSTTDEALAGVIKHAGLGNKRAKYIKAALQTVYDMNVAGLKLASNGQIPLGTELGQRPGTADFIPGMLSIDCLCTMSKKDTLNFLLSIEGIGVKTAICIMEFNLGFALCAVDTHVMKMATWLKHLPPKMSSEIAAFNHLDGRYPEDLKHAMHQVFWHHAQVCKRCKRKALVDDNRPEDRPCPIEHLVERVGGKGSRTSRKSQSASVKKLGQPNVKQERRYRDVKDFQSKEDALAAGYELWEYSVDDDFAAGSINVTVRQCYRKLRFPGVDVSISEIKHDGGKAKQGYREIEEKDDDDIDSDDDDDDDEDESE